MRRYWVDESAIIENQIEIRGDSFHHICVVCRQQVGDCFEVIAKQQAHFVEIVHMEKKVALAKIIEKRIIQNRPLPRLHLALSLPKFQTFENVLEKSVELGVYAIHPFHSDFSFMKPAAAALQKKEERWRKIIVGATQQTGRGELMELTEIVPLAVLLGTFAKATKSFGILAYEGDGQISLKNQLAQIPASIEDLWIFVGSEGGFSQNDVNLFKDYDLLPVSLGDQVLRVETACVTLLSILKYGLGHFD